MSGTPSVSETHLPQYNESQNATLAKTQDDEDELHVFDDMHQRDRPRWKAIFLDEIFINGTITVPDCLPFLEDLQPIWP
ncbi:hypothetical protein M0R45_005543 [Rubus argutus]|uniref:Uncharacterized protein n=1 Tax=Rubus argutus TaxID=59490 RepID=A0AAW1YMY4_RUBAR